MIQRKQPSGAAPPPLDVTTRPREGDRVRWLGRFWIVEAIYYHPTFGYFFRLRGEEDGAYELVNENGADGKLELVAA